MGYEQKLIAWEPIQFLHQFRQYRQVCLHPGFVPTKPNPTFGLALLNLGLRPSMAAVMTPESQLCEPKTVARMLGKTVL